MRVGVGGDLLGKDFFCTFASHIVCNKQVKDKIAARIRLVILIISLLSARGAWALEDEYLCEVGIQGGFGYYVGDATQHIFNNPSWAVGAQFRYKFDQRWALQVKGQGQNIRFSLLDAEGNKTATYGNNLLASLDVVGEFNFFRFGQKQYDERIRPFTPYIFLGIGASLYSDWREVGAYFPFGFGLKWKAGEYFGIHLAWQHNLYFADNLENRSYYNNTYDMNKANILKNDLTSSLTIGIVFEFGRKDKICRLCD